MQKMHHDIQDGSIVVEDWFYTDTDEENSKQKVVKEAVKHLKRLVEKNHLKKPGERYRIVVVPMPAAMA